MDEYSKGNAEYDYIEKRVGKKIAAFTIDLKVISGKVISHTEDAIIVHSFKDTEVLLYKCNIVNIDKYIEKKL